MALSQRRRHAGTFQRARYIVQENRLRACQDDGCQQLTPFLEERASGVAAGSRPYAGNSATSASRDLPTPCVGTLIRCSGVAPSIM